MAPSVPETVSARADLACATGPGVDRIAVATRKRPGVANRRLSPMAPRVLPAQVTGLASAIPAGKIVLRAGHEIGLRLIFDFLRPFRFLT